MRASQSIQYNSVCTYHMLQQYVRSQTCLAHRSTRWPEAPLCGASHLLFPWLQRRCGLENVASVITLFISLRPKSSRSPESAWNDHIVARLNRKCSTAVVVFDVSAQYPVQYPVQPVHVKQRALDMDLLTFFFFWQPLSTGSTCINL